MTARAAAGAAQDGLEREHVARPVEVGGVEVEPQDPAGRERGGAHARAGSRRSESAGATRRGRGRRAAAASPTSRSRAPARAAAPACRRSRGDEAARRDAGEREHAAAGVDARARGVGVEPGELRVAAPRGARRARCWKPCWAIASPRSRQSSSHAARSGRRWKNGCRSGAGMTSSVARSMPWSSSQSRISAQRSNVAGSTSWSDGAGPPVAHLGGDPGPPRAGVAVQVLTGGASCERARRTL